MMRGGYDGRDGSSAANYVVPAVARAHHQDMGHSKANAPSHPP
jgi:hypothetical protein